MNMHPNQVTGLASAIFREQMRRRTAYISPADVERDADTIRRYADIALTLARLFSEQALRADRRRPGAQTGDIAIHPFSSDEIK